MNQATAAREARLRSLTDQVVYFDPSDRLHLAHFNALRGEFGDLGAAMLVSQDARLHFNGKLELTDSGHVGTWAGWRQRNRMVRHGETSRYTVYDFDAGRIVPLFTRDQTVPAYAQTD